MHTCRRQVEGKQAAMLGRVYTPVDVPPSSGHSPDRSCQTSGGSQFPMLLRAPGRRRRAGALALPSFERQPHFHVFWSP